MMVNPFLTALVFLVSVVFGTYILFVMLRFLFQLMHIGIRGNPLLRFFWKVTDPPLRFLYHFIPGWRDIDFAAIVLMLFLKNFELMLTMVWLYGKNLSMAGLFLLACADLVSLLLNIFFFTLIIQVILSWISPYDSYNNPVGYLLYQLNEPLLRPVRRKLPALHGIDFSPFVVLVGLQLIIILVVDSLRYLAASH